jgi:hypothetical protein
MHGQFTANRRHVRNGAAVPSGTALNLIIDAKSGFVISMDPSSEAAAVGQVGTAQRLG